MFPFRYKIKERFKASLNYSDLFHLHLFEGIIQAYFAFSFLLDLQESSCHTIHVGARQTVLPVR